MWHARVRALLPHTNLTLLVGSYAIDYYLAGRKRRTLGETVRAWGSYLPEFFPVPHPSWRNIAWLRRNSWFEGETLPALRRLVHAPLAGQAK